MSDLFFEPFQIGCIVVNDFGFMRKYLFSVALDEFFECVLSWFMLFEIKSFPNVGFYLLSPIPCIGEPRKGFEYRWTSFDSNFNRIGGFPVFFLVWILAISFLSCEEFFWLNQEEMISKENHDLFFTYVTDIAQVSQDVQVAHVNIIQSVNLVKSLI